MRVLSWQKQHLESVPVPLSETTIPEYSDKQAWDPLPVCLSPFPLSLHQEVIQDSLSGQTRGLACLVLAAAAGGGVVIILQEVEALED